MQNEDGAGKNWYRLETNLIDNYLSLLNFGIAIKCGMPLFAFAAIIEIACHLLRYRIYILYIQIRMYVYRGIVDNIHLKKQLHNCIIFFLLYIYSETLYMYTIANVALENNPRDLSQFSIRTAIIREFAHTVTVKLTRLNDFSNCIKHSW